MNHDIVEQIWWQNKQNLNVLNVSSYFDLKGGKLDKKKVWQRISLPQNLSYSIGHKCKSYFRKMYEKKVRRRYQSSCQNVLYVAILFCLFSIWWYLVSFSIHFFSFINPIWKAAVHFNPFCFFILWHRSYNKMLSKRPIQ